MTIDPKFNLLSDNRLLYIFQNVIEYVSEEKLKLLSVKITTDQLTGLDELLRQEKYPTRSEAIRTAIRDLILRHRGKY